MKLQRWRQTMEAGGNRAGDDQRNKEDEELHHLLPYEIRNQDVRGDFSTTPNWPSQHALGATLGLAAWQRTLGEPPGLATVVKDTGSHPGLGAVPQHSCCHC